MTQQTINNYNDKQREAERALTSAQRVIDNGMLQLKKLLLKNLK